jgi:threonine/homoserine/homoserine lactone efflux protein
MTPGPAVLYVLSQALENRPAKSIWASGGILSANAMYFALSATGLGAILVTSYRVFFLIKWLGAAYLVYLGLRSLLGKPRGAEIPSNVPRRNSRTGFRILRGGFFLQASNPKALLFFSAILPQFIDPRHAVAYQILVLGITSVAVEFVILLIYGELAGRAAARIRTPGFQRLTGRVAGSLLIGAGIGLAGLRRA